MDVDFPNRLAHCKVNSGEFDTDNALRMLADAGYAKAAVVESTN